MPSLRSHLARGLAAGAAGVTATNVVTYLDMALTGRPASSTPARTVAALAGRLGVEVPRNENTRTALGALSGIGVGVAVAGLASVARGVGVRLPAPLGSAVIGATAMAATDSSMALLGVSDPRTWSAEDWARDVVPHLAYGMAVRRTLDGLTPPKEKRDLASRRRPSFGLLCRSAMLGFATGCRGSLGLSVSALVAPGGGAALTSAAAGLVGSELVVDKLPATPSRQQSWSMALRYASSAAGAVALAHREHARPLLGAAVAAAGAAVGGVAGAAWREVAGQRGWTWQAGLAEDGLALVLVTAAVGRT
ncbi:MAG TPA: hypothetical protein VFJ19_11230 [Nocardioidaceae bacterium]|nr:hypothetical protein [Nocardioidaceae bacterium]